MTIDKSWIHIKNRNSDEFWNGLKGFIKHAKNYTNSIGQISCPCKRCLNRKMEMPQTVFAHIHSYGFNLAYRIWVFHGETTRATQAAPIVSESADEIADILNDVASTSEAHDTHGDIQDGVGDPNDSEFTDMLSKPLSLIGNWKNMHTREGVWVNSEAEQTYHRLQEKLTQALAADPEHGDEHAIMREILGQRRGHMTGVGPTLPRKTFAATQPAATPSAAYFVEQQRLMQDLRGQVQTMSASHGQLLDFIATMRETFTQLHPNTPLPVFPPLPPSASGALSSSTAHQPDGDDQAEDLGD